MKKVLAIVLAMMLVLCAAAMAETVKIGVFEPASGDSGAGGKQEMLGMQYANKETPTVEIGGTTYDVELVYADNGSDTTKAPSAANSLVDAGVSVVLGSYGSGVSIAGSDIFKNANIPAIGVTCTNPQVTAGNSHYFRICFLDPFQGRTTRPRSWAPPSPTPWASWATTTTRACAPTSSRRSRAWAAP